MQYRSRIVSDLELLATFKLLAEAYEEIAVIRMQRVRSSVLSTRHFLQLLSDVFIDVKSSYKREIAEFLAKNKKATGKLSFSTIAKNGKTVSVFLSANGKLYGDILTRSFNLFYDTVQKTSTDVVVIGKVGREFYELQPDKKQYKYFDLADQKITPEDLGEIVPYLINYEKVNIFYGRFANVINQVAAVSNVSGEEELLSHEEIKRSYKFLFEPSLPIILNFFEKQVFISFFKQTIHESELARLASRIKAMENALDNIEKSEGGMRIQARKLKRIVDDSKQQQRFSGISLWGK